MATRYKRPKKVEEEKTTEIKKNEEKIEKPFVRGKQRK